MNNDFGGYDLLKNKAAYTRWIKKDGCKNGPEPASYPCFATTRIDGYEEHYNDFLYPAQVANMHRECIFIGLAASVAANEKKQSQ